MPVVLMPTHVFVLFKISITLFAVCIRAKGVWISPRYYDTIHDFTQKVWNWENITLKYCWKIRRFFSKSQISRYMNRRGKILKICNNIHHMNPVSKYNFSKSSGTHQTKNRFGGVEFFCFFEVTQMFKLCALCVHIKWKFNFF